MDQIKQSKWYQQKQKSEEMGIKKAKSQIRESADLADKPELYTDHEELVDVQTVTKDIQVEEFPDGPYGASVYLDQKIGKSSPWEVDQHVVSRFQDENPVFSDRKVPIHGEHADQPGPKHGGESPEMNN
ncbi:hypothetical protein LSG31_04645 [Fodinisporobacter ferrooxydans]|uniref:Transposase n=1 Tax=Fodinisporobacter ferrooxydans TaxID=2901836 RepID=A0ABY4CPQ3_9BACL|nr:hypothetical protein LSG31_04645 [Alicyclobacillaceae bacterium MYW30-H2]